MALLSTEDNLILFDAVYIIAAAHVSMQILIV